MRRIHKTYDWVLKPEGRAENHETRYVNCVQRLLRLPLMGYPVYGGTVMPLALTAFGGPWLADKRYGYCLGRYLPHGGIYGHFPVKAKQFGYGLLW